MNKLVGVGALLVIILATIVVINFILPAPVTVKADPENPDFVAIAILDCNELKGAYFISREGAVDGVPVRGTASLFDLQVRLAQVDYDRVHFYNNPRPCGFKPDESTEVTEAV